MTTLFETNIERGRPIENLNVLQDSNLVKNINDLPNEILSQIFNSLPLKDQINSSLVCRRWREIMEKCCFKEIREKCFKSIEWLKYFGDIETDPSIPTYIAKILNSPCQSCSGKKKIDTHSLIFMPSIINKRSYCLDELLQIVQNPREGHPSRCREYCKYVREELGGIKNEAPYWILIMKDAVSESQASLLLKKNNTPISYSLPNALEAATAIFINYVRRKQVLYLEENRSHYIVCRESVWKNQSKVIIGNFSNEGLSISIRYVFDRVATPVKYSLLYRL